MILDGLGQGTSMLFSADPEVWSAVWLSVWVSTLSTALATLLALPVGLGVGAGRFRGRRALAALFNTAMGIPTVLLGLVLYALLSRAGPLGAWEILYTPAAMVIGQALLAFPIVAALTVAAVEKVDPLASLTALGLGAGRFRRLITLAKESRSALLAAAVAGFGRVFSEVGLSMMLGGNIRGYTRNITTGIALETGKGEFALGVALGVVLLVVALALNLAVEALRWPRRSRA
jgi:tungstate transport system permease protein